MRWATAHREWLALTGELSVNVQQYGGDEVGSAALYAELTARGVNTLPLRWPRGSVEVRGSVTPEPLTLPPAETLFAQHLGNVVDELFRQASIAMHRALGGEVGHIPVDSHSPAFAQFQQNTVPMPAPSFLSPVRSPENGT